MKKIIQGSLLLYAAVVCIFLFVYSSYFGNVLSEDHERWSQFFSMLAGIGALVSPLVAVTTIWFLYHQHTDSLGLQKKTTLKSEALAEFRACSDFIISLIIEPIYAHHIAENVTKRLHDQGIGFQCNLSKETGDIGIQLSQDKIITIANLAKFGHWIIFAEAMKNEYNVDLFLNKGILDSDFVARVETLAKQIEYLVFLAGECKDIDVSNNSLKYRLSRVNQMMEILIKNNYLDPKIRVVFTSYF
ncbi:hypothetical protein [Shewanella glacialimarina]|uniref:hypothetical protein n=1 Tax=Shewanella glacialimarina TaxID=2590884 RepID=UPI001CF8BDA9|nr:hypothetical protein [Shewanella glacialimarina]UCX05153.1 hypothetical protein FJ709_11965 [Shewanella glacialimarina]